MTDVPDWAMRRAFEASGLQNSRCIVARNRDMAWCKAIEAFARYIAKHEQPPIDPLLIEARKLVAARPNCREYAEGVMCGEEDEHPSVQNALIALRRGLELARTKSEAGE